ncbi:DUF885 family protein [uncultured Algimonas sp.]|uniref:DUF885 domain-containing protein n=1 Tax=uncultured Algimonas sp. TaxID=1547920 RepID=UPI00261E32C8|nr:DUF885 domain-containing protein [uncultured Algimonas sp.]
MTRSTSLHLGFAATALCSLAVPLPVVAQAAAQTTAQTAAQTASQPSAEGRMAEHFTCPDNQVSLLDGEARCALPDSLDRLIADFEANSLINDPVSAGDKGDRAALRRLPDAGPETRAAARARLDALDRRHTALRRSPAFSGLAEEQRLNYEMMGFMLDQQRRLAPFDQSRVPFTNDSGFFNSMSYISRQTRFERPEDYEAYAARLTQMPRWFAQHRDNMRRGIEDGFTASAAIMPGIVGMVRDLSQGPAKAHPLYAPFRDMEAVVESPAERQRLSALGEAVINTSVLPAYADLLEFLEDDYVPAARAEVGIGATEEGRNYYRALTRNFTTLDLTPDEVHAMGLREVQRIRGEMDTVIAQSGFDGTFAEFLDFLRTDPQFYAKTETELLQHAALLAKRLDGKMPEFFGRLPRLPYGVIKVPDEIAPNYTTGRYWSGSPEAGRAGNYVVNTYDLSQRPLYNLPALTAHEGVPGHHHQIALAQELDDIPEFRRNLYATAFGEGWGLYSERLAEEMGLYDTPYEKFGQLTYEMWRACRLVVDTGMHWKGWSREQAEACFLENSALSRSNIRTEVDRYISWPGQALAYKVGELKIVELRDKAETALGDDFDIRAFHDAVLEKGSVPLSILERQIDRYIADARRAAVQARNGN